MKSDYCISKEDGWVYPASAQLRVRADMDVFSCHGVPPASIANLRKFLEDDEDAHKAATAATKAGKAKPE
jgi:hypothetical protein